MEESEVKEESTNQTVGNQPEGFYQAGRRWTDCGPALRSKSGVVSDLRNRRSQHAALIRLCTRQNRATLPALISRKGIRSGDRGGPRP